MTFENILSGNRKDTATMISGADAFAISILLSPFAASILSYVLVNRMAYHLHTKLYATTARLVDRSDFVVHKSGTYWGLHFFSDWSDKSYLRLVSVVRLCAVCSIIFANALAFGSIGHQAFFANQEWPLILAVRIFVITLSLCYFGIFLSNILHCLNLSPRYKAIKEGISTDQYADGGAYEPSTSPTEGMTEFSGYPDDSSFYNEYAEMDHDESATIQTAIIENMAMLQQ